MTEPFWRLRYWLFRVLMNTAMWVLPQSRYKRELNQLLWTLGLRVQAHWAALQAEKHGITDVSNRDWRPS